MRGRTGRARCARRRDSAGLPPPPPPPERGYKGVGTPSPPPPPCQRQMPRRPGDLGYDLSVAITDLLRCLGRRIRLCSCHVYNRTRLRLFAAHLTVTSWAVNHFLTPLCALVLRREPRRMYVLLRVEPAGGETTVAAASVESAVAMISGLLVVASRTRPEPTTAFSCANAFRRAYDRVLVVKRSCLFDERRYSAGRIIWSSLFDVFCCIRLFY